MSWLPELTYYQWLLVGGVLALTCYAWWGGRRRVIKLPSLIVSHGALNIRLQLVTETAATMPVLDNGGEKEIRKRFLIDCLTLFEVARYLFGERSRAADGSGFREVFVYLAGLQIDRQTFGISHLMPVQFAKQSAGGVKVAQTSNIDAFTNMDCLGLPCVAHAHSHPGCFGEGSTNPSHTDKAFQARLEQGEAIAIGLIFARSKRAEVFVRFFAGEQTDFEVEVQGNHVEKVKDYVYRFSLDNDALAVCTAVGS